jgi:hypothetical protein
VKGSQSKKQIRTGTECGFHLCHLRGLSDPLSLFTTESTSALPSEKLGTVLEVGFEAWANFGNVSHKAPWAGPPLSMGLSIYTLRQNRNQGTNKNKATQPRTSSITSCLGPSPRKKDLVRDICSPDEVGKSARSGPNAHFFLEFSSTDKHRTWG